MANLIGQVLHNQFRVDEFIASGGMGSVYKVWDLKRSVPLAMKVLHADLMDDPTLFKSFQREARALKKLRHPNIVPFYGLYQTEQFAFLLEHYIDGPSLRDVLKAYPKGISITEALTYMQALCAALGYAHAGGVIHCDIKPGNILIDRGNQIYLTDFGIARHADSSTTTIAGSGTPAYMAPEQIRTEPVTPATDVYALGILLFEILTGQRPFRGDAPETSQHGNTSGERIIYEHLNLQPRNPSEVNPAIPQSISNVILKALSKSSQDRYASTGEFLATLETRDYESHERTIADIRHPKLPAQISNKPRIFRINWKIAFGTAVFSIVLLLFFLLANTFTAVPAPDVDIQLTYLVQQALTEISFTQSAVALVPTLLPPTITETPIPVPSEVPTASPTSQPHVSLVEPKRVSDFTNIGNLPDMAKENYYLSDYNRLNNTLEFTVDINGSKPTLWKANWCAINKGILADNVQKIKIQFFLNGDEILLDRFANKSYINKDGGELDGWSCFAYQTVLTDWQPGIYQIITKFTYLKAINDGKYDYQPGWQASMYNVTVR